MVLVMSRVGEFLGFEEAALFVTALSQGALPFSCLDRVVSVMAPADPRIRFSLVPKAAFEKRRQSTVLTTSESMRVTRAARIWLRSLEVWGSEKEARGFLFQPHAQLADNRPIDIVIQSEVGTGLVLDVLGRLEHGSAA